MAVVESLAADGLTYAPVPESTLSIGRLYTGQDDGSRRVVDRWWSGPVHLVGAVRLGLGGHLIRVKWYHEWLDGRLEVLAQLCSEGYWTRRTPCSEPSGCGGNRRGHT